MTKNLDKELAEAAGLDDNSSSPPSNAAPELEDGSMSLPLALDESPNRERRPHLALLAMLLLMAGGIVVLFAFGFEGAAVYSMPLDKLLAGGDNMVDRRVRIDGELVPGTLMKRDKPCEYRFDIREGNKELQIRYPQCVVPDTFRDVPEGGVLVTAEGALSAAGHFEATFIMAKCASKYNPETHQMDVEPAGPTASR